MKPRTRARGVALQALYEIDVTGHVPGIVVEERIQEELLDATLSEFARQIVKGVAPLFETLDHFIAVHAPEWPLDQVAIIDRNILRIALWEFAVSGETPIKVAINEAVELAKEYGSDSTPRFVNGVLGSLAERQNEIQQSIKNFISLTKSQSAGADGSAE
ncbi:MAG: transcription antitermination factor NusB [Anaerolineales bacterium]|nr:transcription antitermination factor NusB [Anaerolineales bacterium]